MKAIIPVAGSGTRLRPLTHTKPKALIQVGSKPIIAHIVDSLVTLGCDGLIFIISPDGDSIPEYVGRHYHELTVESVIQYKKLGLGHAVSMAEEKATGDELIVYYGDTIIEGKLDGIVDRDVDGVISVKEVEDPRRFGVVNIKDGFISEFEEKPAVPKSNLAIVGLNFFKNSGPLFECLREIISEDYRTKGEYQITDAFQRMIGRGLRMKPFSVDGWFDAGTQQSLLEANRYMLSQEKNDISVPGSIIIPPVWIPESAVVKNSIIGPYVSVADGAIIEQSIISDSTIGSDARVVRASLTGSLVGDAAEVIDHLRRIAIGDHSRLDFDVTGC